MEQNFWLFIENVAKVKHRVYSYSIWNNLLIIEINGKRTHFDMSKFELMEAVRLINEAIEHLNQKKRQQYSLFGKIPLTSKKIKHEQKS